MILMTAILALAVKGIMHVAAGRSDVGYGFRELIEDYSCTTKPKMPIKLSEYLLNI